MTPDRPIRPEIFVGLVGAIGAPLDKIAERLTDRLAVLGYGTELITLSSLLRELQGLPDLDAIDPSNEARRIETSMEAGSRLREILGGRALAAIAVARARVLRKALTNDESTPASNRVYILKSLKHPDEVECLRSIYGEHFVLIGVWADRQVRLNTLCGRIARSEGNLKADASREKAEKLIAIDEQEEHRARGQNVRDAFPLADFFADASDSGTIENSLERFTRLLFAHPCVTPTRAETAMFHAYAASLRSGALGRQVGAALVTSDDGDVLAVGMNEVPKAGGGHYWDEDHHDGRDYIAGHDTNDVHKRMIARQVLKELADAGWLDEDKRKMAEEGLDDLVEQALVKDGAAAPETEKRREGPLRRTWLVNITEFGRDVHAEMAALMAAARLGTAVKNTHLYCTTFPCHICARHLVAAGISKVIYIEPYAKSFAHQFHLDAIAVDGDGLARGKVPFVAFTGVAPRRYVPWFSMDKRKDAQGKALKWNPSVALPRFVQVDPGYVPRERKLVEAITSAMKAHGISARESEAVDASQDQQA